MAYTLTIDKKLSEVGAKCTTLRGRLVFSGNYPAAGETLNLTTLPGYPVSKGQTAQVAVWGTGLSGHFYGFRHGADLTAGKLPITVVATGADLAAGAYPAGVTGDIIQIEIVLPKLI